MGPSAQGERNSHCEGKEVCGLERRYMSNFSAKIYRMCLWCFLFPKITKACLENILSHWIDILSHCYEFCFINIAQTFLSSIIHCLVLGVFKSFGNDKSAGRMSQSAIHEECQTQAPKVLTLP